MLTELVKMTSAVPVRVRCSSTSSVMTPRRLSAARASWLLVFYELNTKIHGPKRPFLIHKNTEIHERR